jgi:DNA-binding winged helix-turn-helix (wHTH) protein
VSPPRLKFGDFVLDPGTRQLRRGGEDRHLGPKAFDLLELLLARRPNVVTKEAIHDRLWSRTFVTGSTLATVVAEIRVALDEDARTPFYLRTVHGLGYAFSGEATEERSAPAEKGGGAAVSHRLLFEGREVSLHPGENLLGRVAEGVVWIDSPSVSRRHARILVEDGVATLEDLGSKNGTYYRGERISSPVPLLDADEFRLGQVSLKLRILLADASTRTDAGR